MLWQLNELEYKAKISDWRVDGRRGFPKVTDPQFLDYILQRVRGRAVNSGPQLHVNWYSAI